uniref:Homeobox domain-containing protein n=1 Tax=Physcomitrium patens TaxID=3218 RepID=A0A7I4ELP8_PHYPA
MDPSEPLRAYGADSDKNLQTDSYNGSLMASDSYNFLTGAGVLDVPLKEQNESTHAHKSSKEGAAQNSSGPSIETLYTNHEPSPSSGSFPGRSSPAPECNSWDNINGGGLYGNSNMQNILISGSGMMAAPTSTTTAQLLIGGLHGGSFNDGSESDQGSIYYTSSNHHDDSMAQLYYVNAAAGFSNPGFHSDGRQAGLVTTSLYPSQHGGTSAQQSSTDQSQQQFGVPFISHASLAHGSVRQRALESTGAVPILSLHEHSGSHDGNHHYNWRNGGNEHPFLPMNAESNQNHQSQFDTDLPQYAMSRASHADLSHMQRTDHLQSEISLHMDRSHGSSTTAQAAAMAKTKELASRYLTGANADLSRFRTPSRDDVVGIGARFLQKHNSGGGRKHLESSNYSGPSGTAGSSNHISASKFERSAQAILNEVCSVTPLKRPPKPIRSPDQQHWSVAGGRSIGADANLTYTGRDDRSAMLAGEVDSVRDPALFVTASSLVTVSQLPLDSETVQELADAARCENRVDLELKKQKLNLMLDEVETRYRRYCEHLQLVITGFNSQAGPSTATPYTILALQAMSRHFRCLKDAIGSQLKIVKRSFGEDERTGQGETSRIRYVDQQIRQQRTLQQLGMLQQHAWRPQRGLPERAVSVLRAWLFEHFLHPYPKDVDKMSLAKQTGLTRSQVSNWFINARVRLWKPMVEEMYVEEQKEYPGDHTAALAQSERMARDQVDIESHTYEQYKGGRGHTGLLQEISAGAQSSRLPNGLKRNEDREHDTGASVSEAGGISSDTNAELYSQLIPRSHHLDIGAAGNYNQEGREAKKPRTSGSDAFNMTSSTTLMHPGMDVEASESCARTQNFSSGGELDLQRKSDVDFGTQCQVLNQINQDENGYTISQQGTTIVDQIEPSVASGTFAAYNSNIGHRYGNEDYSSRTISAALTTSTGVSLTLGLCHCDTNQLRSSLVSPILVKSTYNMDVNDQMNQLNGVEHFESRTKSVSNNCQSSATMSNGHYNQISAVQDDSDNSTQQLSPHHEFVTS